MIVICAEHPAIKCALTGILIAILIVGCSGDIPASPPSASDNQSTSTPPTVTAGVQASVEQTSDIAQTLSVSPTQEAIQTTVTDQALEEKQMISFETLSQRPEPNAGIAEELSATLFVSTSVTETDRFTQWFGLGEDFLRIQRVDFSADIVVAFFRGTQGTGGYDVRIQSVERTVNDVRIVVQLIDPIPGRMLAQAFSHPYHVIKVARADLNLSPDTRWAVVDQNGEVLVEMTYP